MNIGDNISKAIKEGRWLHISYINKSNENTNYWIAINDIIFDQKKFKVRMFNPSISMDTIDADIYFDRIQTAEVIENTSYGVPDDLVDKIEKNLSKCEWLNYDHFNHNILNYYIECNMLDNDPCQKEYSLISGIDLNILKKNKHFKLSDEQMKQIIKDIYKYDINKKDNNYYTLAMNYLSIDINQKKYVVCYYPLTFNPKEKTLVVDEKIRFNQSFLVLGKKYSLFNYINMNIDEFTTTFIERKDDYLEIINNNLKHGEYINQRPEIMLIQRNISINLSETYNVIENKYNNNRLPIPLKSFFGNITRRNYPTMKKPSLIILDKKININQMRVLYNAMKYHITYVQGPPGTGKTQTIINVILSAFVNDKTMLICSSNNKPVDGIVDKLQFNYNGENINFPYLRLGNFEDVKKATLKIKQLYNYQTDKIPQDELLEKIKINNDDQNKRLNELLNIQEKRIEIENCLECSTKLKSSFENKNSKLIIIIKKKIEELKNKLQKLPEITNEQLISLFVPLNENNQLKQFLFFRSLQYITKLKKSKYADLITICNIEDDNERALEFNKWTAIDDNMKKLTEVFPIIFSTNISSIKLGTPNFMFDLVVMDEAGQCNVATALLPIAKADSLLLVGDPNQLKPVIVLEEEVNNELMEKYNVPNQYNYKTNSILDVMTEIDNISKYILLKYHYRCDKKIINFSNQRYYNNSLNLSFVENNGELVLLDVKNQNSKNKNEVYEEAVGIVDYIERNNIHNAYIITPFVNQKELIKSLLKMKNIDDIKCGTIHSLQGAETDTIIFSTAISPKSSKKTVEWVKDNYELINLAITRAKNKLIIAADTEAISKFSDKNDDLYNLIQYVKNNGLVEVPPNESVKIEIGKSNGSKNEDEFFKTISHFCSCYKSFDAERNVRLNKLFKNEHNIEEMEFDLVLYEKRTFGSKKPIIAFEVNGGEHFGVLSRERSDKRKMDLCEKNNIKLVFISNSFVKAYKYISDIIIAAKDKSAIQLSLFDET